MRPIVLNFNDTTDQAVRVNYRQQDFKIGFGVELGSTGTYSVQHTFDDPADYATQALWVTDAQWYDNEDLGLIGATSSNDGNYAFPIQGVKLSVSANASTIKMTILQA
jgi:hypothetical protein